MASLALKGLRKAYDDGGARSLSSSAWAMPRGRTCATPAWRCR